MTVYFLDSSAVVKRYVAEIGSDWIRQITAPKANHQLFLVRITWVEVLSALARLQREGLLDDKTTSQVRTVFQTHLNYQYRILEVDRTLTEMAGNLVSHNALRAYDAIQFAAAIRLKNTLNEAQLPDPVFLTADDQLLAISQAAGLPIDNPNQHS